jgi:hypothetical protein
MQRDPDDACAAWLAAEQAGDVDRADAALRGALEALPRRSPTPALTDRLMRMAAVQHARRGQQASDQWVAAGLVGIALALTLLPVGFIGVLAFGGAGRIVSWMARTCVWLAEWLDAGVSVWTLLARTGGAVGQAAGSPMGSAALTLTLLVASTALLVLNRYLPAERS